MTISWGAYDVVSGTGLRVGIQVESISTPTNGSTTCTIQFTIWTNPGGAGASGSNYNGDSVTVSQSASAGSLSPSSFAGLVDGSANGSSGPINEQQGGTQTVTYTYSDYGVEHSTTINVGITGTFNGSTPTHSLVVAIPARPIAAPSAPTAATSSRISDTQINLGWTNNSPASKAYAGIKVLRSTDGAGYSQIATPGVVTSYSDTGCTANHKYTYKIEAYNSAGSAQSTATSALWTTPGAPSGLSATKLVGGNIRLTWTNNVNYSEYQVDIYESQNGGAYNYLTSTAAGNTTWDHVAPSTAVTHRYKILAATTSGTALYSDYSNESATIVLLSTAGAPTGLAVSAQTNNPGNARTGAEAIVFTWTHNPTDATPQTKYQLQYSTNGGGAYTTVGPTTSGVSSYTLPAATLANNQTITWRVATAGENGTIGSYSATSVFDLRSRPTATFSVPTSSYTQAVLVANWSFFQAESGTQTAWQAWLYRDEGGGIYTELETKNGTTESTVTFDNPLTDGQDYAVRVRVTSSQGLQSTEAGGQDGWQLFTVSFLPTADVGISAVYDSDWGRMVVTISGDFATVGVTEEIDHVDLLRQIDGGAWVTWATGIVLTGSPLEAVVHDTAPTIHGSNTYKAIGWSALPSSVESSPISVDTTEARWGFLSVGPSNGFSQVVRMRARLAKRASVGRSKATYHFAGRPKPVELSDEAVSRVLSMAATLYPPSRGGLSSEPDEVEELAQTDEIVLWRDYTGRRIYASIGNLDVGYDTDSVLYPIAFSLTEVDYNEDVLAP